MCMKHTIISLLLVSLSVLPTSLFSREVDTYIPKNAYAVMPIIAEELASYNTPFDLAFVTALIERESCISLHHSRCFSTKSRLKTYWRNGKPREEGAGLMQLTRTWRGSGKLRFDTLTRLTSKYKTHLKGLNWKTVYSDVRLQVRAGAFLLLDNWNGLPDTVNPCNKLPMVASAYNQGLGGVNRDRRLCGMKKGCNPNVWFGNVEKVKRWGFATRILYGRRTAWDINRKHINLIMKHARPKYIKYYNRLGR